MPSVGFLIFGLCSVYVWFVVGCLLVCGWLGFGFWLVGFRFLGDFGLTALKVDGLDRWRPSKVTRFFRHGGINLARD